MSRRPLEEETITIIDNLRKVRKEKKISALNLAAIVGISNSHLFYIETKKSIPSLDLVIRITKALELDPVELFCKK